MPSPSKAPTEIPLEDFKRILLFETAHAAVMQLRECGLSVEERFDGSDGDGDAEEWVDSVEEDKKGEGGEGGSFWSSAVVFVRPFS